MSEALIIITYISTAITSIGAWVVSKKWIIPYIIKWWKEKKKDDVEYKRTIQGVEEANNSIYQNQITFLNSQLEDLQDIISNKSKELRVVYNEVSQLRIKVKHLELELIQAKEDAVLYIRQCCSKTDCPQRVPCANADKLLQKYLSDKYPSCDCEAEQKEIQQ